MVAPRFSKIPPAQDGVALYHLFALKSVEKYLPSKEISSARHRCESHRVLRDIAVRLDHNDFKPFRIPT
jgi:hypothetical protein